MSEQVTKQAEKDIVAYGRVEDTLKFAKFEIVCCETGLDKTYLLELDMESLKQADKEDILSKLDNMGMLQRMELLLRIFGRKHYNMTPRKAREISEWLFDVCQEDEDMSFVGYLEPLMFELADKYTKVFTSSQPENNGKKKKGKYSLTEV